MDGDEKKEKRQVGFRDAMIRLAYYHVVDNTLHVIWLRYFWPYGEGRPYTDYTNNSEILNILLVLEVMAWTGYKMYESVPREGDAEKRVLLEEVV